VTITCFRQASWSANPLLYACLLARFSEEAKRMSVDEIRPVLLELRTHARRDSIAKTWIAAALREGDLWKTPIRPSSENLLQELERGGRHGK
jgi:hypothetical protein